jgi:4-hydroxybutyrate CoA-transferase
MLGKRRNRIHLLAPIGIRADRGIETGANPLSSPHPITFGPRAMPRKISPENLPDLLRPGMTVFVQGASGEPSALLQALATAPEASDGVGYVGCFIPGVNRINPASFHPNARLTSFFVFGDIARSHAAGKVRLLPLHYSGIWDHLAGLEIALALIQVTPPDRAGRCSLGVSVHFVPAVLERAKVIVAESNAAMPRPAHSYEVPYERLDYIVETDRPLVALDTGDLTPEVRRIGAHVAGLVDDGDTIQIGIGKVPAAVLRALWDRRGLGLHGGLVSDEVADLHDAGVITGARKSRDAGTMICATALGSARVYDWAGRCPSLRFAPVSYTHDVRVLGDIDNFVAINSVLCVDLSGQGNAEMLDGLQVSGTGGLLDFVRGTRRSRGGRSILALPSTAGGGRSSRIVPRLGLGDIVSCPRADADIVVTEHGVARLRDKSVDERAEALIAIADPAFRNELAEQWEALRRKGAAK